METIQNTPKNPKLNLDFKDSKYATGRRKKSIAKVWLKKGTGKIYVNGKLFDKYFVSENHKMQIRNNIMMPLLSARPHPRRPWHGPSWTGPEGGTGRVAGALQSGIEKGDMQWTDKDRNTGEWAGGEKRQPNRYELVPVTTNKTNIQRHKPNKDRNNNTIGT